jgi:hypothetical protein
MTVGTANYSQLPPPLPFHSASRRENKNSVRAISVVFFTSLCSQQQEAGRSGLYEVK